MYDPHHAAISGLTEKAFCTAQWVGYIKDYDGGTLMECVIHAALPYLGLPSMVAAQRAALDRRIRALSNAHIVRPGLPPGLRPLPVNDIPGAALPKNFRTCPIHHSLNLSTLAYPSRA